MKPRVSQFSIDGGGDYSSPPATTLAPAAQVDSSAETNMRAIAASKGKNPSSLASQESGAIGANQMRSQVYGVTSAPAKAAKAPLDKSKWDRGIKVSQSTVDSVKRAGAYDSQKNAKEGMPGYYGSSLNPKAPASNEYKEAVKRVYPNAAKEPKPAAKSKGSSALPDIQSLIGSKKPSGAQNMPYDGNGGKIEKMPFRQGSGAKIEKMPFKPSTKSFSELEAEKPKIRVSQKTVDTVKSQGKSAAQAQAKSSVSSKEYAEAVRRVYPTRRPTKSEGTGFRTEKSNKKKSGGSGKASAVK